MPEERGMNVVNCAARKCAFWDDGLCNAGIIDITSEDDGIICATYRPVGTEERVETPDQVQAPVSTPTPMTMMSPRSPVVPPPPRSATSPRGMGMIPPPPVGRR